MKGINNNEFKNLSQSLITKEIRKIDMSYVKHTVAFFQIVGKFDKSIFIYFCQPTTLLFHLG